MNITARVGAIHPTASTLVRVPNISQHNEQKRRQPDDDHDQHHKPDTPRSSPAAPSRPPR